MTELVNARKLLLASSLAVVVSAPAEAVLINSWDYSLEAGFQNIVPGAGVTTSGNSGPDLGLPTKMAWGVEAQKSSLVLNPLAGDSETPADPNRLTGNVATSLSGNPVIWATGTTVAHNNFPITGTDLSSATIFDQFNLDSVPVGSTNANRNPFFLINFQETTNFPDSSPLCVAPSGDGTGCMDIFVIDLTASALGVDLIDGSLALILDQFTIDDYEYLVAMRSNPGDQFTQLQTLTDAQCGAAGALSGCVGVLTKESLSNVLALQFAVVAAQVPEPGMLALFGTGLLGLGSLRIRNRRKK